MIAFDSANWRAFRYEYAKIAIMVLFWVSIAIWVLEFTEGARHASHSHDHPAVRVRVYRTNLEQPSASEAATETYTGSDSNPDSGTPDWFSEDA